MWQDWKNPKVLGFGAATALIAVVATATIMRVGFGATGPSTEIVTPPTAGGKVPNSPLVDGTDDADPPNEAGHPSIPTVDFGNGIVFRQLPLADFQNAGASCVDTRAGMTCEIANPENGECPGVQHCATVTYTFNNGYADGISAEYGERAWNAILRRSQQTLGTPTTKYIPANPQVGFFMSSRSWTWRARGHVLTLVHFEGLDFRGEPIKHPYAVTVSLPNDTGSQSQENHESATEQTGEGQNDDRARGDVSKLIGARCYAKSSSDDSLPICGRSAIPGKPFQADQTATQIFLHRYWNRIPSELKDAALKRMQVVSPFAEHDRFGRPTPGLVHASGCIAHDCGGNEIEFYFEPATDSTALTINQGGRCAAFHEENFKAMDRLCSQ
jgi:hypothetical protein